MKGSSTETLCRQPPCAPQGAGSLIGRSALVLLIIDLLTSIRRRYRALRPCNGAEARVGGPPSTRGRTSRVPIGVAFSGHLGQGGGQNRCGWSRRTVIVTYRRASDHP